MTQLDGRSLALGAERLKALQALLPEAFADGKIDLEALRSMLEDVALSPKEESYRFTWAGKAKTRYNAHQGTDLTLRPCPEESLDWDSTGNLYIEGDNLEALKILLRSYSGAIKMIYIDPPYNTGGDFIYKDDYGQSLKAYEKLTGQRNSEGHKIVAEAKDRGDQAHYHTDWLNMIYPRLVVARKLLSEDGLIFISIDDHEVHNLRKICDEIFGEDNFRSCSIVMNNRGGRDYGGIALQHDYLLIYAKSEQTCINLIDEGETKIFDYYDSYGGFNLMELRNRNVKFNAENRPNLCYPFYVNPLNKDSNGLLEISLEPQEGFVEVYPAKSNGIQTVWRWGKEEKARGALNIEIFGKENRNGGFMIVQKYRKTTKMQRSIWDDKSFLNERGSEAVKELLGPQVFSYPKSPYVLKRIVELGANSDSLILDFFSGSATTAHAVMQLNAEDGGNRKYICVQLPEKTKETGDAYKVGYHTLCEIGKERIRRAGRKIKEEAGEAAQDLDTGFRVFKVDTSAVRQWEDPTRRFASELEGLEGTPAYTERLEALVEQSLREELFPLIEGREGDLVYELLLQFGLPLDCPVEYLHTKSGRELCLIAGGATMCCFDLQLEAELARELAELAREREVHPEVWRVVFLDRGFASDADKLNLEASLVEAGLKPNNFVVI